MLRHWVCENPTYLPSTRHYRWSLLKSHHSGGSYSWGAQHAIEALDQHMHSRMRSCHPPYFRLLGALWRCWTPKATRAGVRYFAGFGRDLSHPSSFTQNAHPNPSTYHAATSVKIADHFRCSTVNFLLLVNGSFGKLLHSGSLGTWPSLRICSEPGPISHANAPLLPLVSTTNYYFHRTRAPHSGSVVARRQATLVILLGGAGFQGTLAARPDEVKHPWAATMYVPRFAARPKALLEGSVRSMKWSYDLTHGAWRREARQQTVKAAVGQSVGDPSMQVLHSITCTHSATDLRANKNARCQSP